MNKKSVPAREFAERFGVSTRTIYRDVDTLSLAGIPVYTEKGKGGGISLLPDFVLNKSILSEHEQREILAALHGLSNIKTSETSQVLKRLSVVFNKKAVNWMEADFSGWNHLDDFFNDFKVAIIERRIAEFDYYNTHGEKTFRRIEPVQLWFKFRAWYIRGFCLKKQDMRLYKMSRVKNLVITSEHFYERDTHSELGDTEQAMPINLLFTTLKLYIAPEMSYRVFDEFDEDAVQQQADGSFIVDVSLPDDNWIMSFILSFGEHIEVLEPEHLRKALRDKAQKIANKYS